MTLSQIKLASAHADPVVRFEENNFAVRPPAPSLPLPIDESPTSHPPFMNSMVTMKSFASVSPPRPPPPPPPAAAAPIFIWRTSSDEDVEASRKKTIRTEKTREKNKRHKKWNHRGVDPFYGLVRFESEFPHPAAINGHSESTVGVKSWPSLTSFDRVETEKKDIRFLSLMRHPDSKFSWKKSALRPNRIAPPPPDPFFFRGNRLSLLFASFNHG